MASWTVTEPRTFDLDEPVRRLDVLVFGGRLNVVGTDGPPRVEVGRASRLPLIVSVENGTLSVKHESPRAWPGPLKPIWWWLVGMGRVGVEVSVAVPYETAAELSVASGPVVVSSMRADLSVECTSGRVALLGVHGRIRASVVSGSIEALSCGGELRLETVSGEITVAESTARRLYAKTVSGAVTADLDNPPHDSQLAIETVSGEITVRVREDSDLDVALSATGGKVSSDFPGLARGYPTGTWTNGLHGRLGAGTGRLTANAISGQVTLLRRPVDDEF